MILMNMFSSFDPSSLFTPFFLLSWILFFLVFSKKSKMKLVEKFLFNNMKKEFEPNTGGQKSMNKMFISIFFFVLVLNISGLLPSSFSLTSHISLNFSLACFLWISCNLFSLIIKSKSFFSHLVPIGTPLMLVPLMILIELVSNLIRPITLSVRLTANMIAGHILISLVESLPMPTSHLVMIILITLEIGVAFIQAYVFSMLLSLYFSENN